MNTSFGLEDEDFSRADAGVCFLEKSCMRAQMHSEQFTRSAETGVLCIDEFGHRRAQKMKVCAL